MKMLSYGGGLQTTALLVLAVEGKAKIDMAVFSDTGGEKPETYWYIENYVEQLFHDIGITFEKVRNELPSCQPDLYGWLWKHGQIPPIGGRRLCSLKFKTEAVERHLKGQSYTTLIGFSLDETNRAEKSEKFSHKEYPLIDMGLTANDCRTIIAGYGLPLPLKSSCFFCPFQHPAEWNWLKNNHRDLFDRALALEAHYHERRPDMIDFGLVRGFPLRRLKEGIQPEMFADIGYSCWSGNCGH
uniref:Putative phosphoadenosine phosphosulfate n=1 Tax=viral metagenome TaxID=1070528 RepID=A0A6H1ZSJ6_9ZZZZ